MSNRTLHESKNAIDNDEFYTMYSDISAELPHYFDQLKGKYVYCNCDNPLESNFVLYLVRHFREIGLFGLTATCIMPSNGLLLTISDVPDTVSAYSDEQIRNWIEEHLQTLDGDGSFQSQDCLSILDRCDIVITNPPFSLFRTWYDCVKNAGKQFLILCNMNTCLASNISGDIIEGKVRFGSSTVNKVFEFTTRDGTVRRIGYVCWFTNMAVPEKPYIPLRRYDPDAYQRYDGQDIPKISRVSELPDYDGVMGVPTSFLFKHNPHQFRLVGIARHGCDNRYDLFKPYVQGKEQYQSILIQKVTTKY